MDSKCNNTQKKLCISELCDICLKRSFESYDLKKVKCWSLLNDKKPRDVLKNSNKKYYFDCICNHRFYSILCSITKGFWCPYCSNQKLCDKQDCISCFNKSFASFDPEKLRCWSDENKEKPRDVFKGTQKKYRFKCDSCNHIFSTSLYSITTLLSWCPYCSNQKLCDKQDCISCFNKSFASFDPEKVKCWSNENKEKPRDVFKGCSARKYCFDCNCSHNFVSTLDCISKGSWCPYCSCPQKNLCRKESCISCFNKSFASFDPEKVKCWSDENKEKPRDVFKGSYREYLFECTCGHKFKARINSITSPKHSWCPYCAGRLCDLKDCVMCFNKSFASFDQEKVKCWSERNTLKPRDVSLGSERKIWFNCMKGEHPPFESNLNNITLQGCWCPLCKLKTESKLNEWLNLNKYDAKHQPRFEWCRNPDTNKQLPFDFCIETSKLIIELDGKQHFHQVSNWDDPKIIMEKDHYKMKCAKAHGYSIIRILQNDVWKNKNNWESKLRDNLFQRDKPEIIYLYDGVERKIHERKQIKRDNIIFNIIPMK